MVGTSKILTVSYGTFSCTLEGFDDSFNTMKAIAEYFRGLAADDRYFGAEPPTPDAEMLAKIAEREISRRVDARMDDGGIVLRAAALSDQSADAGADADADAPQHDKESRAEVEAARKAAKAARKAEKAAAKKAAKAARKAEAEAKAKADAEADAAAKADADAKAEAQAQADAKADHDVDAPDADDDDTSILSSVGAATAAASEGTPGSDVEETRDDAPSSMLAAKDPAPENTADVVKAPADADSVAAKLQRIRAVVGKADAGNTPSDDLGAQFLPQTDTPDVSDVDAEVAEDPVADFDAHEAEMEHDAAPLDADVLANVMAGADATPEAEADADAPRARVVRMKRADFEKSVADAAEAEAEADDSDLDIEAQPATSAGPDLGMLDGADDLDEYLEDSDFIETDLSFEDEADLAEDLKLLAGDADGAVDADDAVAVSEDETTADADEDDSAARDTAALAAVAGLMGATAMASDDDAEESAEAVADVNVEVEVEKAEVEVHAEAEPEVVAQDTPEDEADTKDAPAAAFLSEDPQVDEAALDRLMSETDVQMKEPEGSRRRDAIAQLKAAVAAKEAARQVGEPEDDDQDVENAFRNDLSEAVRPEAGKPRPRPVVRGEGRTPRPRPAPLKLVAAQRVDLPEGETRDGPVIPRRVAARKDDTAQQQAAGSFAEFADNMGAKELPDLLEAAAAYTSFVEGADEFSRPQLLRRVRAVASDDFNREDGLRSFADLLRAGRFTKVRNGRFQVADDSRFNPERRAG